MARTLKRRRLLIDGSFVVVSRIAARKLRDTPEDGGQERLVIPSHYRTDFSALRKCGERRSD
jgi:hypothetical protein